MAHRHVCDDCGRTFAAPETCDEPGGGDHADICPDCYYAAFGDAGILATYTADHAWQGVYLPTGLNSLTFERRITDLLTWIRAADRAGVTEFPVLPHDLLFGATEAGFRALIGSARATPGTGRLCRRLTELIRNGDLLPPTAPAEWRQVTALRQQHRGFLYLVDEACDFVQECLILPDQRAYLPVRTLLINPTAYLTNPRLQHPA